MQARIGIALLLLALVGLGAAAYFGGLGTMLNDPRGIEAFVERAGLWAPIAYVTLFAVIQPFGFPGIVLIAAATMAWPLAIAFVLSWLGAIGAGVFAFALARLFGREWIATRLPARLRAYDQRLAARPLRTVVLVRLLFFLNPLAHWFLGLSPVRLGPLVVGSAIGFIPGLALAAFAGGSIVEWLFDQSAWIWLAAGAGAGAAALLYRVRRPVTVSPQV